MPKKKLKVAVLIRHYNRSGGGAERYCVELTERLADIHDVDVFSQNISEHSDNIKFHKIKQWVKRPRFINQLLFSWMTRKATQGKYDIVHSHDMTTHANIHTLHVPCVRTKWTKTTGIKKILRWTVTLLSPRKIGYLWLEYKQMQIKKDRHLISVSEYLSRNILENYPKLKEHITIAHPGIEQNNTLDKQNIQQDFRQANNIAEDAFIFLFIAHRFKQKGLQTVIHALEQLNNQNIHVVVVGNGNKNEINFQSEEVQSNIHFIGVVNKMDQVYPVADALIHPTLGDTYGMVVLEAMSHKLPVIVSDSEFCGFSEHIVDGEAILLHTPNNAIEISEKINLLYSNTNLQASLAEAGFRKAQLISWDATLVKTLEAYKYI
jgi:UDP-glucose:(heptosyl)LPS alpha-1,3-glucosyltransferase